MPEAKPPQGSIVVHAEVGSFLRGAREVLRDVTLTIRKGEHWSLVGPNGSGKTSLLRILSGYEWPTRGAIDLQALGAPVDRRALRRHIGLVSSAIDAKIPGRSSALDVVLSGLEASFGLWRVFDEEERARARASLASMRVSHLEATPYEVLSQGERQRVLIARALVNTPTLLILDEACSGLDAVARESFLADLGAMVTSPASLVSPTVVFVTHHLEEIAPFLGHALLLSGGRAVAQGPASEVFTSAHVSSAYGAECEVRCDEGRYFLRVRNDREAPSAS